MPQAPLRSPLLRRSEYLAEVLKQGAQPQQIQGWGELAARLLAQGLNQKAANKTDAALAAETSNADLARRQRIAAGIGGSVEGTPQEVGDGRLGNPLSGLVNALRGKPAAPQPVPQAVPQQAAPPIPQAAVQAPPVPANTQEPVSAPVAPVAPVQGAPLPGGGQPMAAQPQASPQQSGGGVNVLPQEREYILRLLNSRDPADEARAVALIQQIEKRTFTPDIQIGPDGTPYNANDPSSMSRTFADRQNINGFLVDQNNPRNEGRYFPDLPEGVTPLYDQSGNVTAVRNIDGSVQALGERERATSDARNASEASYAQAISGAQAAGRAPYEAINVPTATGAPAVVSREAFAQGGGVFQGQTPADAILAEGAARSDVTRNEDLRTRADVAGRTNPTLDNMERLLPDVIAGFGADARLTAARALAAAGNEQAIREVTATQTFLNEARQVVASILRKFGANPTEGERNYAERMSGADASLTPETLAEGIRLARERNQRDIGAYEEVQGGGGQRRLSPEEASRLPPGSRFVGMDGRERTRQ